MGRKCKMSISDPMRCQPSIRTSFKTSPIRILSFLFSNSLAKSPFMNRSKRSTGKNLPSATVLKVCAFMPITLEISVLASTSRKTASFSFPERLDEIPHAATNSSNCGCTSCSDFGFVGIAFEYLQKAEKKSIRACGGGPRQLMYDLHDESSEEGWIGSNRIVFGHEKRVSLSRDKGGGEQVQSTPIALILIYWRITSKGNNSQLGHEHYMLLHSSQPTTHSPNQHPASRHTSSTT